MFPRDTAAPRSGAATECRLENIPGFVLGFGFGTGALGWAGGAGGGGEGSRTRGGDIGRKYEKGLFGEWSAGRITFPRLSRPSSRMEKRAAEVGGTLVGVAALAVTTRSASRTLR